MADTAAEIQRVLGPEYGPQDIAGLLNAFHADEGVTNGGLWAFYTGLVGDDSLDLNAAMQAFYANSDPSPAMAVLLTEGGDYLTSEGGLRLVTEASL